MGKGDKKSKRGKIIIGSHGVRRAKKRKTSKKSPDNAILIKEKKTKPEEIVVNEVIVEPVIKKEEPIAEIIPTEEKVVKKTPKKAVSKKTGETPKTEVNAEPKPKITKAKKKPEGKGDDFAVHKEE
jgi:30S ribosomal protein S31